jgi:hypothetical protein
MPAKLEQPFPGTVKDQLRFGYKKITSPLGTHSGAYIVDKDLS